MLDNVLVAKGYRPVDRDQLFLQPPDMREWLPAADPVWLVIDAVAHLDTAAIHRTRRTGGVGRAGYDPDMLLTVLIWGWANGHRSSRTLERLCSRDVAFRIICAGDAPDHATISRFRADSATAMENLYVQVLMLCARLGMGNLGVVALDGVKIASNASISANRTKEGLDKAAAEQALADAARAHARAAAAAHADTDAAEDELYGPDARGDDVPADLVDPRSRAARIAEALAELTTSPTQIERAAAKSRKQARQQAAETKRAEQLEAYEAQREQRDGPPLGLPPTEIRVEVLTRNLERARADHQAKIDRHNAGNGRGKAPGPVEQAYKVTRVKAALDRAIADRQQRQLAESAAQQVAAQVSEKSPPPPSWLTEPKRNITDPQSRMMPLRGGGWLQGYNCQAVTSSDGLIIATAVGNNPNDATTFAAMLDKAVAAATLIVEHQPGTDDTSEIGVLLADAGYLSEDNLAYPGPDRLIAVGRSRAVAVAAREQPAEGPPPADATPLEAMAHRLRTPEGHALYKQRSHIAETPFAHAKHNLGFRRFSSRGITRASAEFTFHALVHNLVKAIRTNNLAAAT